MRLLPTLALLALGCAVAQTEEEPGESSGSTGAEGEGGKKSKRDIVAQYSYCQEDNCYELLGVTEKSKLPAIKRKYRNLAAEWHPDKNPDPKAREIFQKYANAYEVLSNAEVRAAHVATHGRARGRKPLPPARSGGAQQHPRGTPDALQPSSPRSACASRLRTAC